MPAWTSRSTISDDDVAGPIVQTIFVRRSPSITPRTLARGVALPASAAGARERGPARVDGLAAELFLDPQKLVVLRDAIAPRGCAGLDLADAGRDGQIRDRRVLGLAGAVRHDRCIPALARELDRLERLRQRPDLVDLDEDRVGDSRLDAAPEALDVGDEEVVPDELHSPAEPLGQSPPAVPVVLGKAVLDRDDGIPATQLVPERDHAARIEVEPLSEKPVPAALDKLCR